MIDEEKLRQLVRAGKVQPSDAFTRKLSGRLEAAAKPPEKPAAWSVMTIVAGFLLAAVASGGLLLAANHRLGGGVPTILLAMWSVVLVFVLQACLYYTRSLKQLP